MSYPPLIQVYGHPRSKLMTFSALGKPLSPHVLRRQYRLVLSRVQSGELTSRARTILTTVMRDRHVFRGGTSVDKTKRKKYYEDLIAECKEERAKAAVACRSRPRTRKRAAPRIDIVRPMHSQTFKHTHNTCSLLTGRAPGGYGGRRIWRESGRVLPRVGCPKKQI